MYTTRPPWRLFDARWALRGAFTVAVAFIVAVPVPATLIGVGVPARAAATLAIVGSVAGIAGLGMVGFARLLGCRVWRDWNERQIAMAQLIEQHATWRPWRR